MLGSGGTRSNGARLMAGITVALAVAVSFFAATYSLARVIVKTNPERAHFLAPYDGRITAAFATALSEQGTSGADRRRSDDFARLALEQDPTAVAAVSTLGINADLRGDTAMARRLFTYAQKLSRRDLRTQLWMIEDSVRRGDIASALHEYDIALRVFPRLSDMLYPVLAEASSDPEIRPGVVRTLIAKPLWGDSFINYVAVNGHDSRATAGLFHELARAGVTIPEGARAHAINALLAKGEAEAAWNYYASTRPGADRRRSRDPAFAASFGTPSQFDWMTINDASLSATLQNGLLDFVAPTGVGGPLLQQFQLLTPGTYRLTGHSIGIDQVDGARAYWALACHGGRELGRVVLQNSAEAGGAFTGNFTVPQDCPVQMLTLIVQSSDSSSVLSGQIDRVELVPSA